jgi:hypothetical protein
VKSRVKSSVKCLLRPFGPNTLKGSHDVRALSLTRPA